LCVDGHPPCEHDGRIGATDSGPAVSARDDASARDFDLAPADACVRTDASTCPPAMQTLAVDDSAADIPAAGDDGCVATADRPPRCASRADAAAIRIAAALTFPQRMTRLPTSGALMRPPLIAPPRDQRRRHR
jgi:hypothetical protein